MVCLLLSLILIVKNSYAECVEYKIIDHGDRLEAVCIGQPLDSSEKNKIPEPPHKRLQNNQNQKQQLLNQQQGYQTTDSFGNLVNSNSSYQTKDSFGNLVNSKSSYQATDALGNLVNSKSCYQAKDSFGNLVQSQGCYR